MHNGEPLPADTLIKELYRDMEKFKEKEEKKEALRGPAEDLESVIREKIREITQQGIDVDALQINVTFLSPYNGQVVHAMILLVKKDGKYYAMDPYGRLVESLCFDPKELI